MKKGKKAYAIGRNIPKNPKTWPAKDLEAYKTMTNMELVKARRALENECWAGRCQIDWNAQNAIDTEFKRRDKLLKDLI